MKKIMSCAVVFMMLLAAGSVYAATFADHVKIAPNGKGDMLIYPVYLAAPNGWESKITLINTALDRSVVSKIVFRSRVNTQELRDFLIYLSPTDVWTGLVRISPTTGNVQIYSTDDSALSAPGVWASEANPLQVDLAPVTCADDTNAIGYIEVFMSAHTTAAAPATLNTPPATKQNIFTAYSGLATPAVAGNMVADGINVLAGHMELRNISIGQTLAVPATVFRDYDATLRNGTPLNIVDETLIGELNAWNSRGEVEAALSKNNIALPYSSSNLTVHLFTFPTKLTVLGAIGATQCTTGRTTLSPYFDQAPANNNRMCVPYTGVNYDLRENSAQNTTIFSPSVTADQFCAEVNYVTNFSYPEGWANYVFTDTTTFAPQTIGETGTFGGAPVIPTVVTLDTNNGFWGLTGAYSDVLVSRTLPTAIDYYYYQYQDESNTGYLYDADMPTPGEDQGRAAADGDHPLN